MIGLAVRALPVSVLSPLLTYPPMPSSSLATPQASPPTPSAQKACSWRSLSALPRPMNQLVFLRPLYHAKLVRALFTLPQPSFRLTLQTQDLLAGDWKRCGPCCCSRRGACLSASLLLLLALLAVLLVVATVLGRPPRTPETQSCVTMTNRTGFLCHDRRQCIPAHRVCDGIRTCAHGEDEEENLCRDVPQSLPSFLLAHCGDPASWIYSDQKCDGTNNCGDCSDELSPVTVCPPCGPGWWPCTPTLFRYCSCIPRVLCRDRVQHCADWSDEYICPGP